MQYQHLGKHVKEQLEDPMDPLLVGVLLFNSMFFLNNKVLLVIYLSTVSSDSYEFRTKFGKWRRDILK